MLPGQLPKKWWKSFWSRDRSVIWAAVVVLPLTVARTSTSLPVLIEPMPPRWAFTVVELFTT